MRKEIITGAMVGKAAQLMTCRHLGSTYAWPVAEVPAINQPQSLDIGTLPGLIETGD